MAYNNLGLNRSATVTRRSISAPFMTKRIIGMVGMVGMVTPH